MCLGDGTGLTVLDSKEPIGPEAFPYGSVSKSFAGVLTLKLVEKGLLSLDDPLSKFHFDVPGDDEIKIRELLSHTSGLAEYFYGVDPATTSSREQILTMIRSFAKRQPHPRGSYFYSNANFYLLSEICAQVGGAPYGELLDRYVLHPIGISPRPTRLPTFDLRWYGGAGELAGTIQDLATYGQAIATQDHRLLSARSWEEFAKPRAKMGGPDYYGFGLIVAPMNIYPTLSHAGEIPPNGGEDRFVSMFLIRPAPQTPVTLVAFRRAKWEGASRNAIYGSFSSVCAAIDVKTWLARFCAAGSETSISAFVDSGALNADFGRLLTKSALQGLRDRIGSPQTYMVSGELIHGDSIKISGTATGTQGSAQVTATFGPGGRLDGLRFQ
jgi:CubicO group peptidase (beta-lactamase class C family)